MYSTSCSTRFVGAVDVRKLVKRVFCSDPQTPVSASILDTKSLRFIMIDGKGFVLSVVLIVFSSTYSFINISYRQG
jgi:hypothetical protein